MLEYYLSSQRKEFTTVNGEGFRGRGNVIVEMHMFELQERRCQLHSMVFHVVVEGNVLYCDVQS
jgi:hypothetical protein